MTVPLRILHHGSCEPFKAVVHGASMTLCALMGLYNAAAWINRREKHLAINAIVYGLAVAWEQRLVAQHVRSCRPQQTAGPQTLTVVVSTPECCDGLKVA